MSGGNTFTGKEINIICSMKKQGATWGKIGAALNRNAGSCKNLWLDRIQYEDERNKTQSQLRAEQEASAKAFENKILLGIKDSISKFNTPKLTFKTQKSKGLIKQTPILDLSDIHNGQIPGEDMRRKFSILTEKVLRVLEIERKSKYMPEMVVFLKGDMVEGEDLFPTQPHEINLEMLDQLAEGSRLLADLIQELSRHFKKITVECVPGNHGRVGMRYSEHTNWDCVFYIMLEAAFSKHERVKINWTKSFDKIVEVEGWQHMLFHGDNINMALQTPIYGINNAVASYVSYMIEDYPQLKYFHIGHFHTAGTWDWNNRVIVMTGCFPPANSWTKKRIKKMPSISQYLHLSHKDLGITHSYKIHLELDKEK